MKLEFQNLVIRSALLDDADTILSWWNDGSVMAHAGFPNGLNTTKEEVENRIKRNNEKDELLIIEINNTPIGEMHYREIYSNTVEMGIKICDPNNRSRGYGSLIISLLISYLKNNLDCKKIVLDVNLENERAQHFYRKNGFIKDRVEIDSWTNQLGEKQSSVHYFLNLE